MTVFVANRLISSPAGLSGTGQAVLGLIQRGAEWLQWAIHAPGASYSFADESALLTQVQQGLHVTAYTLLPTVGLMASPAKLLTLGMPDLRLLTAAEAGDSTHGPQLARVLAAHALLTQADFAAVPAWLQSLGVAQAPVFQFMGYSAHAALYPVLAETAAATAADAQEAAAFALQQAVSPAEFGDYFRLYLTLGKRPDAGSPTPAARQARAQAALQTLAPLLFTALDGPSLSAAEVPAPLFTAQAALNGWLHQGRVLGFSRVSLGMAEVVRHTPYAGETGAAARALVDAYVGAAQAFLAGQPLGSVLLGQDGASCLYTARGNGSSATVALAPQGVLTLQGFMQEA